MQTHQRDRGGDADAGRHDRVWCNLNEIREHERQ